MNLYYCHNCILNNNNRECDKFSDKAVDTYKIISDNYSNVNFDVNLLSSYLGLSRSYVNELCVTNFEVPPRDLIKKIRLENALYILINTNLSIQKIAKKVGYLPRQLHYTFKNYFKLKPYEVKKYLLNSNNFNFFIEELVFELWNG